MGNNTEPEKHIVPIANYLLINTAKLLKSVIGGLIKIVLVIYLLGYFPRLKNHFAQIFMFRQVKKKIFEDKEVFRPWSQFETEVVDSSSAHTSCIQKLICSFWKMFIHDSTSSTINGFSIHRFIVYIMELVILNSESIF